jgi:hypothetical protein
MKWWANPHPKPHKETQMSKDEMRAQLEAMIAGKPVTKLPPGEKPDPRKLAATPAERFFERINKPKADPKEKRRVKRNWEAQARYDREHGTYNGGDEILEDQLAIHRYEMGDY